MCGREMGKGGRRLKKLVTREDTGLGCGFEFFVSEKSHKDLEMGKKTEILDNSMTQGKREQNKCANEDIGGQKLQDGRGDRSTKFSGSLLEYRTKQRS